MRKRASSATTKTLLRRSRHRVLTRGGSVLKPLNISRNPRGSFRLAPLTFGPLRARSRCPSRSGPPVPSLSPSRSPARPPARAFRSETPTFGAFLPSMRLCRARRGYIRYMIYRLSNESRPNHVLLRGPDKTQHLRETRNDAKVALRMVLEAECQGHYALILSRGSPSLGWGIDFFPAREKGQKISIKMIREPDPIERRTETWF